ncbi:hypothetical protein LA080_011568 [Diaporthe eres]|nr:hypothetical protein LA080_011568 [Diaporthe eres]
MNTEYVLTKYNPYRSRTIQQAATYARECYGAGSSGLVECNTFVQRTLAAVIDQNAWCPFANSICKSTTGNILLDSGLMDSHRDFGFNSPPDQRFQYRHGILRLQTRPIHSSLGVPPSARFRSFNAGDGDIEIFFLSSNRLRFTQPTEDPWFNASTALGSFDFPDLVTTGDNATLYYASEPASPLGFSQSVSNQQPSVSLPPPDSDSDARFTWAFNSIWYDSAAVEDILDTLGAQALLARAGTEVEHWFSTTLASLQRPFVNLARGPDDDLVLEYLVRPANSSTREAGYCKDQKVLSTAYVSFSMLGLLLTLTFGATAILVSYSLEPILECVHRRTGRHHYTFPEWATNQTLQLQRVAYEETGSGNWSRGVEPVPVTESGEALPGLDLSNPHHPRLSANKALTKSGTGSTTRPCTL